MSADGKKSEDPLPPEKRKKEVISVYLALVGFLLILASFIWNLLAALETSP